MKPVELDSIDTVLNIADIIRHTGQPNYKCARIPIRSSLQVEAWEKYLRDYSDKRVLQYIKYGFLLSLINPNELNNKKKLLTTSRPVSILSKYRNILTNNLA